MQRCLYNKGGVIRASKWVALASLLGPVLLASAAPGKAHAGDSSRFWKVQVQKARDRAVSLSAGRVSQDSAAPGVRQQVHRSTLVGLGSRVQPQGCVWLLFADLQPAGAPDPAGQGAGPAVPLPHSGHRQHRRERLFLASGGVLVRGAPVPGGAAARTDRDWGEMTSGSLSAEGSHKPVVGEFLGRRRTQGVLLPPRPRGPRRQCCPSAFTGQGESFAPVESRTSAGAGYPARVQGSLCEALHAHPAPSGEQEATRVRGGCVDC